VEERKGKLGLWDVGSLAKRSGSLAQTLEKEVLLVMHPLKE
jgi:hypothetical protein